MRRGPKRGPQSVKRNLVFRGKKGRKRQNGGVFTFGLIASAAALLVVEVVKSILNKNFGGIRRRRKRR